MDICVFTITNNMIRDAIISRHEQGVRVRIVTDDNQACTSSTCSRGLKLCQRLM